MPRVTNKTWKNNPDSASIFSYRTNVFICLQIVIVLGILARLFYLQVYQDAAAVAARLGTSLDIPTGNLVRGSIYVRDGSMTPDRTLDQGQLFPVATNTMTYKLIQQGKVTVTEDEWKPLAEIIDIPYVRINSARAVSGFYTVLKKDIDENQANQIKTLLPTNMRLDSELKRAYPDKRFGGQLLGFLGYNQAGKLAGQYGLEGFYDDQLQPKKTTGLDSGSVVGQDLILTIDRAVQYQACQAIADGVKEYRATSGSVVIVKPQTGAIIAMCSAPDFYPENYSAFDLATFRNPIVSQVYEPGSTFKSITMAAGLDSGKVTPLSTYIDKGEEKIDRFTIRNADKKAHGRQTMVDVLEKSLNLGVIHVERLLGRDVFRQYVQAAGYGRISGIDLAGEAKGNITSLDKKNDIFMATASFGQGITATPIQVVMSYAAIANQGKLMKPYIVDERRSVDGQVWKTKPTEVMTFISDKSASLLSGMLAAVLKFGHAQKAEIAGYTFAGKTGTSQVASSRGGYEKGKTIQTFVGYGPVLKPEFAMLVKYDNPERKFAESSALPTWKNLAQWMINYWRLPSDTDLGLNLPTVTKDFPVDVPNTDRVIPAPTVDF